MATKKPTATTTPTPVEANVKTEPGVDVEAVRQEAVEAERERLRSIEAIAREFEKEDSRVVAAVTAKIDELKYDGDLTADSVRASALQAAFDAQKGIVDEARKPRRKLAGQLEDVPSDKPEPGATSDSNPARVKSLRRGFKRGK